MPQNYNPKKTAWRSDQIAKSLFFHEKLHEYGLLKIAATIENIRGEDLQWDLSELQITEEAWNKTIHNGIKPILVFAHPTVLQTTQRAVSYYRMLAMVSQKSMYRIGIPIANHENGTNLPNPEKALQISRRLNEIISMLIEADKIIQIRELDLWRGMAAGSQAQGSWQNKKGDNAEIIVKDLVKNRIMSSNLLNNEVQISKTNNHKQFHLIDGRVFIFSSEPDIAIIKDNVVEIAVEIKGGIDTAGILERVGAAIKSLSRAKHENTNSLTILLLYKISMSEQAEKDIKENKNAIDHWIPIENILDNEEERSRFFKLLRI